MTVTELVSAALGVPEITPPVLMVSPEGSPVAVHDNGALPPLAARVAEYAIPTTPFANDAVVTDGAAAIVIERFADAVRCVGLLESVTVIVAELVPAAVGVPEITPPVLIVNPAASPVADHV